MPAKPHSDLPTLDDQLSWGEELDELCAHIMGCHPPHVFGVQGDWGSGKTSFMRQLQWRLGGDPSPDDGSVADADRVVETEERKKEREKKRGEIATVWFEAWRYQNEAAPVVALLHEMRRQLSFAPAVK
ncbi:MAG TPA: P-loop NTPase fold protein [Accumulibacter sp.]|uniref:P-loop NTPase fold protein n=1 Tax=Accumulibacter sp. TaxID=2053492 RepID=UPI0025FA3FFF|nr:P-loop NTPase fold protein [Accumulibacter sp.]MCM8599249.1 P-loop NTPase fold protein [Accumulibacter sp.]MCM8661600.1 P-loop NTPase fold protein [Accumulibacter sp.]HNC51880.1 P-loop NTPase fold protein [Accumulibacter sp.]